MLWIGAEEFASWCLLIAQAAGEAAGNAPAVGGEGAAGGAQDPAAGKGGGPAGPADFIFGNPLLLFAGMFFLFYLLVLSPERRRQKEIERKRSALKKNDRVITSGGIYGTVVNVATDSDEITIRVDDSNNTRLRVLRSSIGVVLGSEKETPPQ